ncbi:hypothetical protein BV898_06641 [Hypsibius exemplaris]|uniref:BHLH domain-containing protein n=1 Tax=Hypsibius exemplaris TaxID=2072580 RepID=A0A1W0WW15_HYPEX|nr:hypothetical protein BV898_06641 [Hypsibius exemplaris]
MTTSTTPACGAAALRPALMWYPSMPTAGGLVRKADGLGRTTDGLGRTAEGLGRTTDGLRRTADGLERTAGGLGRTTDGLGRTADSDSATMAFMPISYQQQYATYLFPTGMRTDVPVVPSFDCLYGNSSNGGRTIIPAEKPKTTDPFAPECLIPIPSMINGDEVFYYEPVFLRRRNERERQRVRNVNESYSRLRNRLPLFLTQKRMSKVEILRSAIAYIRHLQDLLEAGDHTVPAAHSNGLMMMKAESRDQSRKSRGPRPD